MQMAGASEILVAGTETSQVGHFVRILHGKGQVAWLLRNREMQYGAKLQNSFLGRQKVSPTEIICRR